MAIPLAADEQVIGAVRAEQSTQISDARTRRFFGLLVSLAVAVLTVALVVGSVVAGRLVRPVLRIRDAAVRLGDGDFAIEVPSSGFGELDEAGEAMVVTAQRLDRLIAREDVHLRRVTSTTHAACGVTGGDRDRARVSSCRSVPGARGSSWRHRSVGSDGRRSPDVCENGPSGGV